MKKTLLLLFALMTSIGMAWADDPVNLAQGATVSFATGEGLETNINGGNTLANMVDGNNGTSWQLQYTGDNTFTEVIFDLGETKTFNTVLVNQTGDRWITNYKLYFSTDGTNWTDETSITGVIQGKFATSFTSKNYRYVKYHSEKANKNNTDQWGEGIAEFELYNLETPIAFESITLTASTDWTTVGGAVNLTAVGNANQLGAVWPLGEITWNNNNTTAGTITNGVYNANAKGTSVVSASAGGKTSNDVSIEVVEGSKIDLFTNWQYRIYPIGTETKAAGRDGAVDANDGSLWELHAGTDASEASRTYETGFIVDLGAIYSINRISIHFEGACSAEYGIAFAASDGTFGENVYTGGSASQNDYTAVHSGQSATGVRYVKFLSTKAATQYGVKIKDFMVIGTKEADISDTAVPTVTAAEASKTANTVVLTLTGNDDSSKYIMYQVNVDNGIGTKFFFGAAGTPINATITNLTEGTTYIFSVIAYDSQAKGSTIANLSITPTSVADTEAPVMVSATLASKTYNSATLTLNATDNSSKVKFHIVDATNSINITTGQTDQGTNYEYTVTGLTPETTYNFTVTAEDAAGNTSENNVVMTAFTTEAIPAGQEYINGDHSIFLSSYHYTGTDIYELIITSNEVMTGLGGSFWYTSSDKTDLREDLFISSDRKAMSIRTTSTYDPSLYTPLYILMPGEINFGDVSLTWIEIPAEQATVTNAQWASFSSTSGLDFSNVVGLTAYKATATTAASVHYEKVSTAAANTGLVLNGDNTEARTYYIPVKNNAASHNDNLLKGTAYEAKTISSEEAATNKFLAFGKKSGQIGFVKVGSNGYTVPTGKAYLELTSALAARDYSFISLPGDNGETTSIESLNISQFDNNAPMYNLSGQRVGNNYKGIVIVNGKKMIRK